jgi:sigma-E factor negative regulatory protein RseA
MAPNDPDSPSRRILSALADGEAEDGECADVFLAWREDADARATWHAYQLIGDVLRSEELASPADRSCRLLQGVRARLAEEPVVLAPAEPEGAAVSRPRWQAPAAMAAGFLAVVVGVQVARAPRAVDVATANGRSASSPVATVADVRTVRSVPPDQVMPYVAAHRLSTMDAVLTMPGQMPAGELRNASIVQATPR